VKRRGEVFDTDFEVTYWIDETHRKDAELNFDEVFEEKYNKKINFY
tara:strand:+ start:5613 stop:5750 length:138 start_codon:yes stop_codon:yes gene_type:complete